MLLAGSRDWIGGGSVSRLDEAKHIWAIGATGKTGIRYLNQKIDAKSSRERASAIAALAILGDHEVSKRAAELADPAADGSVQLAVVRALRGSTSDESTRGLKKYLQSNDIYVFHSALRLLLARRPEDTDKLLSRALRREGIFRFHSVNEAKRYIGYEGSPLIGPQTVDALEEIVQDEPKSVHGEVARRALSMLKESLSKKSSGHR